MSGKVAWVIEMALADGKPDEWKALMNEMVSDTLANESNALNYEWYISEDGSHCHIYECYADSDATMGHIANFGAKYAERFMTLGTPTSFSVFGNADGRVREALSPMGATFHPWLGGFRR